MEAKCCIVSELQGLKVGQINQSSPLRTFGSHFGQHFARFEHGFHFQKCSPQWALSAQPNMADGVLLQTDNQTDDIAEWLVESLLARSKARLKTEINGEMTHFTLHISHFFFNLQTPEMKLGFTNRMSMNFTHKWNVDEFYSKRKASPGQRNLLALFRVLCMWFLQLKHFFYKNTLNI